MPVKKIRTYGNFLNQSSVNNREPQKVYHNLEEIRKNEGTSQAITVEREVHKSKPEETRKEYEKSYKKARKEFLNKVVEKGERLSKVGQNLGKNLTKKPILSKQRAKQLIKPISSTSLMKSFARTEYGHVNPAPERVYANDNRSMFFNAEFNNEKKKMGGWL